MDGRFPLDSASSLVGDFNVELRLQNEQTDEWYEGTMAQMRVSEFEEKESVVSGVHANGISSLRDRFLNFGMGLLICRKTFL